MPTSTAPTPPKVPAPASHPPGLAVVFLTEAWERFSYYGMRALLVIYLVDALGYRRADALSLYGTYTMLVYFTPVIGGWIADRFLGLRLSAVIGASVMMLGHFAMAVPSLLNVALGLLVVGNGFFKASTSSLVGELYDGPADPRRDGGYTIFYMGINLGAFLGAAVTGWLGARWGWHVGFAAAGVGMAIGAATIVLFQRRLGRAGLRPGQRLVGLHDLPTIVGFVAASVVLAVGTVAAWPHVVAWFAGVPTGALVAGGAVLVAAAAASGWRAIARNPAHVPFTRAETRRIVAVCVLAFFVVFFWMGFEQAGGSMALFADRQTERHLGGFEVPAAWFQSANPLFIVLFAPFFSMLWTRLDRSRFVLPDVAKAGLGMVVLGLGFIVMTMAQHRADATGPVGPQWLLVVYAVHTMGELMLSPVGLSLVSRAAPTRVAGLLMGLWLFFTGIGNKLAGSLEGLLAGSHVQPYVLLTWVSIGMGLLLLSLTPLLHGLLQSRDPAEPAANVPGAV